MPLVRQRTDAITPLEWLEVLKDGWITGITPRQLRALRATRSAMTHWMRLFSITHSRADFALYGVAVGAMAIFVALHAASRHCARLAALALGGFAAWSLLE